jgi:hypothetical protein
VEEIRICDEDELIVMGEKTKTQHARNDEREIVYESRPVDIWLKRLS